MSAAFLPFSDVFVATRSGRDTTATTTTVLVTVSTLCSIPDATRLTIGPAGDLLAGAVGGGLANKTTSLLGLFFIASVHASRTLGNCVSFYRFPPVLTVGRVTCTFFVGQQGQDKVERAMEVCNNCVRTRRARSRRGTMGTHMATRGSGSRPRRNGTFVGQVGRVEQCYHGHRRRGRKHASGPHICSHVTSGGHASCKRNVPCNAQGTRSHLTRSFVRGRCRGHLLRGKGQHYGFHYNGHVRGQYKRRLLVGDTRNGVGPKGRGQGGGQGVFGRTVRTYMGKPVIVVVRDKGQVNGGTKRVGNGQ